VIHNQGFGGFSASLPILRTLRCNSPSNEVSLLAVEVAVSTRLRIKSEHVKGMTENVDFPNALFAVLLKMAPPSVSIFIFGAGYKTTVRINGREPITSNEGSTSSQIPGGLKKGTNAIEIYVVKQAGKMDMYPSIELKYLDKTKQEVTAFSADEKAMKTGNWIETFQVE
jgi:hypothetical protein